MGMKGTNVTENAVPVLSWKVRVVIDKWFESRLDAQAFSG
jgi:hypothetical protein